MAVQRTIQLDDAQLRQLEQLASDVHCTLDDLVGQAVQGFLARRNAGSDDWRAMLDAVVASFREGVPPGLTPQQIESDITAARAEYWAERRGTSASGPSEPDAGCR